MLIVNRTIFDGQDSSSDGAQVQVSPIDLKRVVGLRMDDGSFAGVHERAAATPHRIRHGAWVRSPPSSSTPPCHLQDIGQAAHHHTWSLTGGTVHNDRHDDPPRLCLPLARSSILQVLQGTPPITPPPMSLGNTFPIPMDHTLALVFCLSPAHPACPAVIGFRGGPPDQFQLLQEGERFIQRMIAKFPDANANGRCAPPPPMITPWGTPPLLLMERDALEGRLVPRESPRVMAFRAAVKRLEGMRGSCEV